IVVQETEYTGAGKHINPQLSFARQNGIDIHFGDPADEVPGKSIILPAHPSLIQVTDVDLDRVRRSHIKNAVGTHKDELTQQDIQYLVDETNSSEEFVRGVIASL
ncbi:MAG: PLP-dependent lyase/thiolase, partial [Eubacteriales bacterium]|nr:PLP-dependent lyase/thiolase [Eubacteriales bacterium]